MECLDTKLKVPSLYPSVYYVKLKKYYNDVERLHYLTFQYDYHIVRKLKLRPPIDFNASNCGVYRCYRLSVNKVLISFTFTFCPHLLQVLRRKVALGFAVPLKIAEDEEWCLKTKFSAPIPYISTELHDLMIKK